MKTKRSLIRRLCFALITARTLAFAAAPMVDLQILPVGVGEIAVMTAPDQGSSELAQHDPSTCAICAFLHDAPWSPSNVQTQDRTTGIDRAVFGVATNIATGTPRQGFLSRAPPSVA